MRLLCFLCSQFITILCTVIYRKCVLNIQYVISNVKTLKRNLVGIGLSFSAALYNSSADCIVGNTQLMMLRLLSTRQQSKRDQMSVADDAGCVECIKYTDGM